MSMNVLSPKPYQPPRFESNFKLLDPEVLLTRIGEQDKRIALLEQRIMSLEEELRGKSHGLNFC